MYGLVYVGWQVLVRYMKRHASVGHILENLESEYPIVEEVISLATTTPAGVMENSSLQNLTPSICMCCIPSVNKLLLGLLLLVQLANGKLCKCYIDWRHDIWLLYQSVLSDYIASPAD